MGKYCLTKKLAEEFKKRVRSGEIDVQKQANMTSAQRREFFAEFLGEADAKNVNSLFESKLLKKNREKAIASWAREVTGIKPEVRRDLLSRIEKMAKDPNVNILDPKTADAFYSDLVATKLGADVTMEEAKKITKLANKTNDLKAKMDPETFKFPTEKDALDYGSAKRALEKYVGALKLDVGTLSDKAKYMATHPLEAGSELAGITKSLRATLDNSFIGRQGIKVLWTNPKIWTKNAINSFKIIGKTLAKKKTEWSETDAIIAEGYSRANSLNGRMKKAKLAIGQGEEAFPTSLPERIPLIGRLFKASEQAYTGSAYKMRMDLFDDQIAKMEQLGIDVDDVTQLESVGKMINSLTGRGSLGKAEAISKELNNAFFSIKFLKSNLDTLTAHQLQKNVTPYVRKESAKNLLKIITGTASVLATANALKPGSVEWDPNSADFGKIRVGDTRFDITGGMGSLIVLASRIRNQESKSSTTGKTTKLGTGFGQKSGTDIFLDFFTNKLSPAAAIAKHLIFDKAGFMGKPLTLEGELTSVAVPMSIENFFEMKKNPRSANLLASAILEGLGISTHTYSASGDEWSPSDSKTLQQFMDTVGEDKFKEANREFNTRVNDAFQNLFESEEYKNMSEDDRSSVRTKIKDEIKDEIFKSKGFEFKRAKIDKEKNKKIDNIVDNAIK